MAFGLYSVRQLANVLANWPIDFKCRTSFDDYVHVPLEILAYVMAYLVWHDMTIGIANIKQRYLG